MVQEHDSSTVQCHVGCQTILQRKQRVRLLQTRNSGVLRQWFASYLLPCAVEVISCDHWHYYYSRDLRGTLTVSQFTKPPRVPYALTALHRRHRHRAVYGDSDCHPPPRPVQSVQIHALAFLSHVYFVLLNPTRSQTQSMFEK